MTNTKSLQYHTETCRVSQSRVRRNTFCRSPANAKSHHDDTGITKLTSDLLRGRASEGLRQDVTRRTNKHISPIFRSSDRRSMWIQRRIWQERVVCTSKLVNRLMRCTFKRHNRNVRQNSTFSILRYAVWEQCECQAQATHQAFAPRSFIRETVGQESADHNRGLAHVRIHGVPRDRKSGKRNGRIVEQTSNTERRNTLSDTKTRSGGIRPQVRLKHSVLIVSALTVWRSQMHSMQIYRLNCSATARSLDIHELKMSSFTSSWSPATVLQSLGTDPRPFLPAQFSCLLKFSCRFSRSSIGFILSYYIAATVVIFQNDVHVRRL